MNKYTIEQSGRSMIEMLGVLAIVGVLSVAGIAGYSKAMAKYKTNKVVDQITMTAANIRTTFAGQGNYNGLTTEVAHNLGVFPEEMDKDYTSASKVVKNAMGGAVDVGIGNDTYSFDVKFDGLSKDTCSTLVTADWGSASGFLGFTDSLSAKTVKQGAGVADLAAGVVGVVSSLCTCSSTENTCSLIWRFK